MFIVNLNSMRCRSQCGDKRKCLYQISELETQLKCSSTDSAGMSETDIQTLTSERDSLAKQVLDSQEKYSKLEAKCKQRHLVLCYIQKHYNVTERLFVYSILHITASPGLDLAVDAKFGRYLYDFLCSKHQQLFLVNNFFVT